MGSREHPLPLGWEGRRGHPAWWEQRWGPRAVLAHPPCSPSAEPGSGSCKPRPPCTDKDFFYTHTAYDAGGEVMRGHPGVVPLSPGVPPGSPAPAADPADVQVGRAQDLQRGAAAGGPAATLGDQDPVPPLQPWLRQRQRQHLPALSLRLLLQRLR